MKKYIFSAFLLFALISSNVAKADTTWHDVKDFSFFDLKFSDLVEFKYFDEIRIVSKDEAKHRLRSLIKKLKPKEVTRKHKGFSKNESSNYGIVKIVSDQGNYRIFYYGEKINGNYRIKRIRVNRL